MKKFNVHTRSISINCICRQWNTSRVCVRALFFVQTAGVCLCVCLIMAEAVALLLYKVCCNHDCFWPCFRTICNPLVICLCKYAISINIVFHILLLLQWQRRQRRRPRMTFSFFYSLCRSFSLSLSLSHSAAGSRHVCVWSEVLWVFGLTVIIIVICFGLDRMFNRVRF